MGNANENIAELLFHCFGERIMIFPVLMNERLISDSSLGIAPDKSRIGGRIAIRNQRAPLRERRIGQIAVKQLGVKNKAGWYQWFSRFET